VQSSAGGSDRAAAPRLDAALAKAQTEAAAKGSPVVVVVHADWCEPCNELHMRVLEAETGQRALAQVPVVMVDFDTDQGAALAAKYRVLGLPTTLVLRPFDGGLGEVARIEGFENAKDFVQALETALQRREPTFKCAQDEAARQKRLVSLPGDATATAVVDQAECLAADLVGDHADAAAAALHVLRLDRNYVLRVGGYDEVARGRVLASMRLLGRWESRVHRRQDQCADVFARLRAWPGLTKKQEAGLVFWQARCLAKAGQADAALQVLDRHIADAAGALEAKELAGELLVFEKVASAKALALLTEVVAAQPTNHWAHYLLAELALADGNRLEALARYETANKLKPDNALYLRHLDRARQPAPPKPSAAPAEEPGPTEER
jgi:thioredoxin-like negative regulator of GroEL